MKHAFLIEAHTNWGQLRKLIATLDDSRNSIFVHVDAKAKDFNPSFFQECVNYAYLEFIPRIPVTWGAFSQVKAEISLIRNALKSNSDYYHIISGFDLPLHNMDYFDIFFKEHLGKEFVQYYQSGDSMPRRIRDRIEIYHPFQEIIGNKAKHVERIMFITQRLLRINRLRNKHIVLGKGTNWCSITHNFAQYVIDVWPQYKKIFSSSFCADEMLLQTILLSSPFKNNAAHPNPEDGYTANMRLVKWSDNKIHTFTTDDYQELINSKMLIARKFDERVDDNIISEICDYVRNN